MIFLFQLISRDIRNSIDTNGIINNTNSLQITGIHALPIIFPNNDVKEKVEALVNDILQNKKKNPSYNYTEKQKEIDNIIFQYYAQIFKFPSDLKSKLDKKYSIYSI